MAGLRGTHAHFLRLGDLERQVEPLVLQQLCGRRPHRRVQVQHGFDDVAEGRAVPLRQRRNASVAYQDTEFSVSLGLVERRLPRAELVDETPQRPDVGLGVVCFFLHEFRGHVVRSLRMREVVAGAREQRGREARTPTYVFAKLAWGSAFDRPKSPSLMQLLSSRKTTVRQHCLRGQWGAGTHRCPASSLCAGSAVSAPCRLRPAGRPRRRR